MELSADDLNWYGEPWATVENTEYVRAEIVVALEPAGPRLYCFARNWASTEAGKLAVRESEIAELALRVAELEDRNLAFQMRSAETVVYLKNQIAEQEARIAELHRQAEAATAKAPTIAPVIPFAPVVSVGHDDGHLCPVEGCAAIKPAGRSMTMHLLRRHGLSPDLTPAKGAGSIALVAMSGEWVCGMCGSSAFTRSLSAPDRCMRCAKDQESQEAA